MKKTIWNINDMARIAIVASLYVVLTLSFAPLSFGALQFRFSELLVLLCFYNKKYCPALIIGCFLANLFTPGVLIFDLIFGTLHTVVSVYAIAYFKKNLSIACIMPAVFSFIVGIGVSLSYELPYILTTLQIAFGELVVVLGMGYPMFKSLENNKGFRIIVDSNKTSKESTISSLEYAGILLSVILIILFFTSAFQNDLTLYYLAQTNIYIYAALLLPIVTFTILIFLKNKIQLVLGLVASIAYSLFNIYMMIGYGVSFNAIIMLLIDFMLMICIVMNFKANSYKNSF